MVQRATVWILIISMTAQSALGWSEGGHHVIAYLAMAELPAKDRAKLLSILKAHPKFESDFVTDISAPEARDRFLFGTAAFWPDVARKYPQFNRPNWHYQIGAAVTLGENIQLPESPTKLPEGASLESKDLHIVQAIDLCRRTLRSNSPDSEKAIALCWLAHLVGDAHQPCHAGSLFAEGVFPEGDRGGNSILTKQRKNLHSLWDGLLGSSENVGDVSRRVHEIQSNTMIMDEAESLSQKLNPSDWIVESIEQSRRYVYSEQVLHAVTAAQKAGAEVEKLDLPEQYLKEAGGVAQRQAAVAGKRLARILAEDLAAVPGGERRK